MRVLLPIRNKLDELSGDESGCEDGSIKQQQQQQQPIRVTTTQSTTAQSATVDLTAGLPEAVSQIALAVTQPLRSTAFAASLPESDLDKKPAAKQPHELLGLRKRKTPSNRSCASAIPADFSARSSALDRKPPARVLPRKKTRMVAHNVGSGTAGGNSNSHRFRYSLQHNAMPLRMPETMSTSPPSNPDHPVLWGVASNAPNSTLGSAGGPLSENNGNRSRLLPTRSRSPNSAAPSTVTNEEEFVLALKNRGLEIQEQAGDGNCLFRAISLQVYGDPTMHCDIRRKCLDFMERDKEHFSQFVTGEPFDQYIVRKRQDGVHGNHTEIQAVSELFNRPVEVFCPQNGASPLNIFHAEYKTDDAPIRLSYHDGNHYNAVIDPLVPTAGLGLGLPGLQPGLADKTQMAQAVAASDQAADEANLKRAVQMSEQAVQGEQEDELQRALKESQLSAEHMHSHSAMTLSDMDATYFELEQAALESSLSSYSTNEHGKKRSYSTNEHGKKRASSSTKPTAVVGSAASMPQTGKASPSQSIPISSPVASLPTSTSSSVAVASGSASIPAVAAAASASVASVASIDVEEIPTRLKSVGEYPPTVQELVMNGFELDKVVRAFELIGDNFDSLLEILMSNAAAS